MVISPVQGIIQGKNVDAAMVGNLAEGSSYASLNASDSLTVAHIAPVESRSSSSSLSRDEEQEIHTAPDESGRSSGTLFTPSSAREAVIQAEQIVHMSIPQQIVPPMQRNAQDISRQDVPSQQNKQIPPRTFAELVDATTFALLQAPVIPAQTAAQALEAYALNVSRFSRSGTASAPAETENTGANEVLTPKTQVYAARRAYGAQIT